MRNQVIPSSQGVITDDKPDDPVYFLGDPAYSLLLFMMKEFKIGRKSLQEHLHSAEMVIECVFGCLKARLTH